MGCCVMWWDGMWLVGVGYSGVKCDVVGWSGVQCHVM